MTTDQQIEAEIQAKGKTAPRITPPDIEANIASEHYFTAADGVIGARPLDVAVNRFLACPVPASAHPDGTPGQPGRTGTNLLSAPEAKEVLAHVMGPTAVERPLGLLTFCVLVLRNGFTVTGTSACASPENFDAEIGRKVARQDAVRQVWPLMGYQLRENLWQLQHGPAQAPE